jgi:hypothetical protein
MNSRRPVNSNVMPPSLADNMTDIEQFVRDYDGSQKQRIEFAWNGKHASEFLDANQEFRSNVVAFVCENSGQGSLELLRDLFIEESKWSVQAWCAPFTFANLGGLLLTRGGVDYLPNFLDGFNASFDTFGACHQIDLDPIVASALLRHALQQLNDAPDEPTRTKLESGKQLFEKLQAGNATQGWATLKPGTPVSNIRVVGHTALAWRRIKSALKLR